MSALGQKKREKKLCRHRSHPVQTLLFTQSEHTTASLFAQAGIASVWEHPFRVERCVRFCRSRCEGSGRGSEHMRRPTTLPHPAPPRHRVPHHVGHPFNPDHQQDTAGCCKSTILGWVGLGVGLYWVDKLVESDWVVGLGSNWVGCIASDWVVRLDWVGSA